MERGLRNPLFSCAQVVSGSVALFNAADLLASVSLAAERTTHFKVFYLFGAASSGPTGKFNELLQTGMLQETSTAIIHQGHEVSRRKTLRIPRF